MKNYKWIRVNDIIPYVKTEDYSSDIESVALCRRLYSAEGKEYPILSLNIYPNIDFRASLKGVKIACTLKRERQGDWDDYSAYIPVELFDDLVEMLAEAKAKIENQ
jgi:hypothetical protein